MTRLSIDPHTLNFDLPEELIAQDPLAERDHARLMVLNRSEQTIRHHHFYDLPQFLSPSDVLVINTAQVDHAKFLGKKNTGGKLEVILLGQVGKDRWKALVRPELKIGATFVLENSVEGSLLERTEIGENILALTDADVEKLKATAGRIPLPPYIKREADDSRQNQDEVLYQTVYAKNPGSIAAPTAGLHFTPALLETLRKKGVEIIPILLNVGWGTFRPISTSVETHTMFGEGFELSAENAQKLYEARAQNKRIVAVGTTATRALESLPDDFKNVSLSGETSLFIRPGFSFRWIKSLITNFHVPRSTPVSLTGTFAGLDFLSRSYEAAILERYRFFSYGDAMLIQ